MLNTFKPLDRTFNIAVMAMAARLMPTGFDVLDDAPNTMESLQAYFEKHNRIGVWSGASESTIFADREVNYAFRAWHDHCHLVGNHPFTPEGESKVAKMQQNQIIQVYGNNPMSRRFCLLIECEVNGQVEYEKEHGDFPVDQMAFTINYLKERGIE